MLMELADAHTRLRYTAVPLLKGANLDTLEAAATTLEGLPETAERANAMNYLLMFGARAFGGDLLLEYVRRHPMLDEQYFAESPWYQEVMRRGAYQMVRRALEGRFGALSDDMIVALSATNQQTLDDIITHVATDTLEQVRARLGLQ